MDWHDASARVPLIIAGPRVGSLRKGATVGAFVSSIDLFPTLLELAGVGMPPYVDTKGVSLVPYLLDSADDAARDHHAAKHGAGSLLGGSAHRARTATAHADGALAEHVVLSQFAGDNVHLPWYALMKSVNGTRYKYVAYGSGADLAHRLFDLDADADETYDLIATQDARAPTLAPLLDGLLDETIANSSTQRFFKSYREVRAAPCAVA